MSESLDIRPYREGDEKHILELFSISYGGRKISPSYWRWRFRDNPSGLGIVELSWDRDIMVSHYAVSCVKICINGKDCLAGLSGTTMTHPGYHRRGLFPILAQRTYREMANRGMVMVWGFPNINSHRVIIRDIGWKDIYEIPTLRLKLVSQKIALPVVLSCVCELFDADERFDRFWEKIHNHYDILVRRDRTYINWRYLSNPIEKYRLIAHVENEEVKGYAVFKHYQNELQVVDLLIGKNEIEIGKSLIEFIISQAIDIKAKSVSLWLNVVHPFHHTLEKIGFRPEGPVTYWGGLILNSQFYASLYNSRRWYFTMSDSDVF